jgi:hypothetical protein
VAVSRDGQSRRALHRRSRIGRAAAAGRPGCPIVGSARERRRRSAGRDSRRHGRRGVRRPAGREGGRQGRRLERRISEERRILKGRISPQRRLVQGRLGPQQRLVLQPRQSLRQPIVRRLEGVVIPRLVAGQREVRLQPIVRRLEGVVIPRLVAGSAKSSSSRSSGGSKASSSRGSSRGSANSRGSTSSSSSSSRARATAERARQRQVEAQRSRDAQRQRDIQRQREADRQRQLDRQRALNEQQRMRSVAEQRARELQKLREDRARSQSNASGSRSDRGAASSTRSGASRSVTSRQPYVRYTPSRASAREGGSSRRPGLNGSRPSTGSSSSSGGALSASSRPPQPALSREAAKAQSKAPLVLYTPPKPAVGGGKTPKPAVGGSAAGGLGQSGASRPSAALSRTNSDVRPSPRMPRPSSGTIPGLGGSSDAAAGVLRDGPQTAGAKRDVSTPGRPLGGNRLNQGALSATQPASPFVAGRGGDSRRPHGGALGGDPDPDGPTSLGGFGDPPPAAAHNRSRPYDPGRAHHGSNHGDHDDGDWRDDHHHEHHHHHHHHHHSYCHPSWSWSWSSLWCGNSYWDTRWYWWNRAHPSWHPYCSSGWDGWRFSFGFSYSSSNWSIGVGLSYGDLWYSAPHHYHWYRCRPWLAYNPCYSTCSVRYSYPTYRPWRHSTVIYGAPVYERVIYRDVVYEDSYADDWRSADAGDEWYGGYEDETDWVTTYDLHYGADASGSTTPTAPGPPVVASAGLSAAWTNLAAGQAELARGQFESLVLTQPDLGGARVGYGLALGLNARLPECAGALRIALVESPEGFADLPMTPALTDRIRQLAEYAAEAVRIDPYDTDALFIVAVTRMLIGDNAVAYFAIDAAYRSGDVRESTLRLREHLNAVMYDEF